MKKQLYLDALDKALLYAFQQTDGSGRMVVEGDIDTKDSGWLVLGAVIRGREAGWQVGSVDLKAACRSWTMASVRVDDIKSAWTTFALLLCFEFTGGKFRELFSTSEIADIARFFRKIDMRFLLEASRNYRVAAAVIDILRVRYGFTDKYCVNPEECITYMLDGYLGEGFFNDDDGRGDNRDLRIDAYSAEIIGLLLHYDEICGWKSFCHDKIMGILNDFCEYTMKLIDADGEFAKWGRSLRGEAEVKKIFLWEYAQKIKITNSGSSAAARLFKFFQRTGFMENGRIGRDKAFDCGIWDEYTTCVQAQGYGIYGLAMALRFASEDENVEPLASEKESYVTVLEKSGIICGNSCSSKVHYIFPFRNRMTKNMFFWHNRITGENDVTVDVSAKFMPVPYFGHRFPAPYSGPVVPFLPIIRLADGNILVPRNIDTNFTVKQNCVIRRFDFCRPAEYVPEYEISFDAAISCYSDKLKFKFVFINDLPAGSKLEIYVFSGNSGKDFDVNFNRNCSTENKITSSASVYSACTVGKCYVFDSTDPIEYSVEF